MMFALLLLLLLVGVQAGVQRDGIIGGQAVHAHAKPWMTCLFSKKYQSPKCGGFLVDQKFVMTAAHCIDPPDLIVILGVQNVKKPEESWQRFERFKPHYFKDKHSPCDNDIVLLELPRPATLNKTVQLIPLPNSDQDIPQGTECNVAGWGRTAVNGKQSDDLLEVNVTVQRNENCQKKMPPPHRMLDTILCTGNNKTDKGPNVFDSGGPLVCNGVVEGIICGKINGTDLALYTHISKYLPWIQETLRHNN